MFELKRDRKKFRGFEFYCIGNYFKEISIELEN